MEQEEEEEMGDIRIIVQIAIIMTHTTRELISNIGSSNNINKQMNNTHTLAPIHTYTYIHIHAHMYTHIHVCTHTCRLLSIR